jgi:hypothetical protein
MLYTKNNILKGIWARFRFKQTNASGADTYGDLVTEEKNQKFAQNAKALIGTFQRERVLRTVPVEILVMGGRFLVWKFRQENLFEKIGALGVKENA